ncbi:MAG: hypothetical protein GF398_19995 [Chitinivibrionales bacterium]|nr:hypothetical protein [Chitinivibrionales bacterium]
MIFKPVSDTDTTRPLMPDALAGQPTLSTMLLSWNASVDPQSGIKQYKVYVDGIPNQTVTTTRAMVTDLQKGTAYQFEVSAVNTAELESGKAVLNASTSVSRCIYAL